MFQENTDQVRLLQPAVLAFVGDAVFNLFIRERLVRRKQASSHQLHIDATRYVKAASQSRIAREMQKDFNEDEAFVFRRGRNAKSTTIPKNANVQDYHYATAFEAVLGYLYLTGQTERLDTFLEQAASIIENDETENQHE
ncbi:MAG TPA: ribonuclease III domain-containing protein [Thermoclostridium caenicola]|uniref:Mini-ribonuclease 3 n=1 Tax=Thermoclostridium caenicola TaxID=659425 RepID=A0A1M6BPF9_9FIRM|nr:ribonuclease III domain-containing protein [Thermoclostridium caenicola]SHI50635.1 ribonuclease-3 family protein [Thermoclostridium caenicola]HOK42253.1 ribonuclease III domain-containing protein [Thermoclostridium caenicola]HOL84198.1 ribonuclease III domain-containing protein [Thermoclostridium caenicola]HOP71766.1 ribonuclease III domain-containing protein [Thermoclostridium caenicola]HPO75966.1 ribonuclease III domain-containing protein [Thermoclostridium caenicola]